MSEQTSQAPTEGLNWKNAYYMPLMWLPNILQPQKLAINVRHPIHEIAHTRHDQFPLDGTGKYVVEHRLLGRLVTIDIVEPDVVPKGFVNRVKQLFKRDYYYGHAEYFPQPFRLIDRTYVRRQFNREHYLDQFRT